MQSNDGVVSINLIGSNNKILNTNGVPIIFYSNDFESLEAQIFENEEFRKFLDSTIFTIENYSDSKIAYCFYKNIDNEDEYKYLVKEVEEWMPLEKKKNLANEYIHVIVDALYKDVYNMKFNWTENIDVDLNTIYDNINAKYKEKFNRLTMVNYIRAELKKYDLRDFNLDFVIMNVDSILRNKDKV